MTTPNPTESNPTVYIPGYRKLKLMMVLYGILLIGLGGVQLRTPLRLLAFGNRTGADAVAVVKVKAGMPDQTLTNDRAVRASETHDRGCVFWNQFLFHTSEGRAIEVRAPVGSQVKPLFTLTDADGLPTETLVCYDPADPDHVVFPLLISVWFGPVVLLIAGLACSIIGATLLYWSNKPIELPHIQPATNPPQI